MQCPNCQVEAQPGAKFCTECGTALPRACAACGHLGAAGAKFCAECGTALGGVTAPAPRAPPAPQPSHAERRHITVMFCDMVGSSALSERLGAEEFREIVGGFLSCCTKEITRLDGMVATYMGDGILAYFGYPIAHEDDAERAVRAGLAIIDAVGQLRPAPGVTLQTRIGIASGIAVVGDLVGDGVAQQNAVIGETTNLASRLQDVAEPDSLVISRTTYDLVGAQFEYHDLGRVPVKGFAEPVHARQVLGISAVESRFEARTQEGTTPILGRDEEIELIERRWHSAAAGAGRLVLITGEAGIGKSRTGRAIQDRLQGQDYTLLTYHCSPYHRDSALHPIIGQITRVAGITRADSAETRLGKIEALLRHTSDALEEHVPLYASLLSVPCSGDYALPDLTPQELKRRTLAALAANLRQLTRRRPVLMIFEDLQWADATSLELLTRAVDDIPGLRLLLLATARPEFTPPWPRHSHVSSIALGRLDNTDAVALIHAASGGHQLGPEVVNQIVERADGIPLFAEELTKTVFESGLLTVENGVHRLRGPMTPMAIPPTLHASLIARLDRLSAAKDLAQIGAAIGRQFSRTLIGAISGAPEAELRAGLDRLIDAELIFERTTGPDRVYEFKHALVHDATYASLVAGRRQQLHARIAAALEQHFPEVAEYQPETLARHFSEAGAADRAITLWQSAGERAISRCENTEAIGHLRAALDQLPALGSLEDREQREFRIQLKLGMALVIAQGQSTPEVEQAYSRARALAGHMQDSEELFTALMGMWRYYAASGAQPDARATGELLTGLAERLDRTDLKVMACMALGISLYHIWDMPRAADLLTSGAVLHETDPKHSHAPALTTPGQHPGFMCAMGMAQISRLGGDNAASHDWWERSLAIGRSFGNPFQQVLMHGWSAVLAHYHLDWPRFRSDLTATATLAEQHNVPVWIAITDVFQGLLKVMDGAVEDGLAQCTAGADEIKRLDYGTFRTRSLLVKAQAHGVAQQAEQGLAAIDEAVELFGAQGEVWIEPELHRIRGGLLLLQSGPKAPAEALVAFGKAVSIAEARGLGGFGRRAKLSRARTLLASGDHAGGQAQLDALMGEWSHDPGSAEWQDARALADSLVQPRT